MAAGGGYVVRRHRLRELQDVSFQVLPTRVTGGGLVADECKQLFAAILTAQSRGGDFDDGEIGGVRRGLLADDDGRAVRLGRLFDPRAG